MEKKSRSGGKKTASGGGGGGGGGIGGLIVVGGALAIAGFVAAFTIKKRRKDANNNSSTKPNHPSKHNNNNNNNNNAKTEDEENQGLRYLVQTSSLCLTDHPDDYTTSETDNSCELVPTTLSLIQEEKSRTEIDGGEKISEILLSGNSDEENIQGDAELVAVHEEKGTIPLETTEGEKKENEASVSALVKEDDPQMHSVEEKEGDDDDEEEEEEEENIMEKVEENSEGTGQSSIELNTDTVWPEELIEGTAKLEEAKQAERIAEHKTSKAGEQDYLNGSSNNNVFSDDCDQNENSRKELKTILWHNNETLAIKEATANSSKLRIWFLSMLILVLLLLSFSFTPHKAMSMILSLFSDIQSTVTNRSS